MANTKMWIRYRKGAAATRRQPELGNEGMVSSQCSIDLQAREWRCNEADDCWRSGEEPVHVRQRDDISEQQRHGRSLRCVEHRRPTDRQPGSDTNIVSLEQHYQRKCPPNGSNLSLVWVGVSYWRSSQFLHQRTWRFDCGWFVVLFSGPMLGRDEEAG